jgi:hypothetical protein
MGSKVVTTMTHFVTFPTAQALRHAGYPQPAWAWGQVWYTPAGEPRIWICWGANYADIRRPAVLQFACPYGTRIDAEDPAVVRRDWVFAPTASDLLYELRQPFFANQEELAKVWHARCKS